MMNTFLLFLPGIVVTIVGVIFQLYPPKKMNNWYGYRTRRSLRSQDTWDLANRFSSWLLIFSGMIGINTALTCKIMLSAPADLITTILVQVLAIGVMILITEQRLRILFDDNGNWREADPEP